MYTTCQVFYSIFFLYLALCEYNSYGNFVTICFLRFLCYRQPINNIETVKNIFYKYKKNVYLMLCIPFFFIILESFCTISFPQRIFSHVIAYLIMFYNMKKIIVFLENPSPYTESNEEKLFCTLLRR